MNISIIKHISECSVKPRYEVEDSKHPYYLTPWDLAMLSFEYPQSALFYAKPPSFSMDEYLVSLKDSLSETLVHFYPFAGQLVTKLDEHKHQSLIYVDCNKGPGVKFIHASLGMTMSDVVSPTYLPPEVRSLCDHHKVVSHDGHTQSLLTIQVTELLDGVIFGFSSNHVVHDGCTFWHFINMWSEIHRVKNREQTTPISNPLPIHDRWVPNGCKLDFPLPYVHPDEYITRYETPELRERMFHFSSSSVARLKSKAIKESNTNKISSFQAVAAFVWRSVVRANRLSHDQVTNCKLAINNRNRLNPPLPQAYFGNAINIVKATTTAGELLKHDLGWAALLVHQSVSNHNDKSIREFFEGWMKSPLVYQHKTTFDPNSVVIANSPGFDLYGNEFGLGKPVAVNFGSANKFVGKITASPGYEGGRSMDFEICLSPDSMTVLESDKEFMALVSASFTMVSN